jgi:hypothetical protein
MVHFLNYCATHPCATLRYSASDMILHIYSDALYLTEPEARSRAGGHHFLGNLPGKPSMLNGPILNISKVIKGFMSSAAEAKIGALYLNAKEATIIRTTLIEMGQPQPATPMETNNPTASGIMNRTVKQVRSKAIDMRFYWVYKIESSKDTLVSIGHQESKILQAILQSIILLHTITTCDLLSSTHCTRLPSQSTCEGVLKPEFPQR